MHVFNLGTVRRSLFVLLLILAGQACGQPLSKPQKPIPLFSISGKPVYTEEFIYLYKKNHLRKDDFTEPKIDDYLNLLVNFKLKVTEAKARGLDTTAAFKKEFKSYQEELMKPFVGDKDELNRLTREAYQRLTEEVKASHILIAVSADASPADTLRAYNKITGIRERIMSGEGFDKIAKDESEDPSAKTNSGNLGYFTALQMVYPFEQAAYSTPMGQVSQPVRTRFGYHLIKITDRRPARGEVEVSHIILRTGQGDNTKVKNKILDIFDQLEGGRSWDELCKEFSDDPATKNSGGRLRPFGVGALAAVPEFEAVAFSLTSPGEISDPFQSVYGWHIVRLEKKIPVPSFEELESSLQRKVSRDERLQLADAKLIETKKKLYGFSEDAGLKKMVMDAADTSLQKGRWKYRGDEGSKSRILFGFQEKKILVSDFLAFIMGHQGFTSESPSERMAGLYDQCVREKIGEIEEEKLFKTNAEYRNLLTEYKEGILLFTIMESEVWTRASADSAGLKNHYEANREKYKAGDRVEARIFASSDRDFADQMKRKVQAGDSLSREDVKRFKSILPARNYEKGENKAIDRTSWTIGLHRVDVDETYYLVEIDRLLPPGIKTFEEARAQVISDYQDVLEKNWIAALKQKYTVKVNAKGRKFVVNELTSLEKQH